jgi:tetratricopeptide (TPR) repeat protein
MSVVAESATLGRRPLASYVRVIGDLVVGYVRTQHPIFIALDLFRVVAVVCAALSAPIVIRTMADSSWCSAPIHRALLALPEFRPNGVVYQVVLALALALNAAWASLSLRNFARISLSRLHPDLLKPETPNNLGELPPWPYTRESFTVILGELQDRDGSTVPNERSPHLRPRWLTLPEKALYTGALVTGAIGSGKTSAVAYPVLDQLIGFRRPVKVRSSDDKVTEESYVFSGLVMDEKGDFTTAAEQFCIQRGRKDDFIRIAPGGKTLWNLIYNPNLPTWAVAFQLGWMLKNFNKGQTGNDPFWENKPKELLMQYLSLLHDAEGYYTLFDYLDVAINETRQNELQEKALERYADDAAKVQELERRWRSIVDRRDNMSSNLKSSLEACAQAGLELFREEELRKTFCPSKDDYFEKDASGVLRPRAHVFTGFDQALDYGKIVGLAMPKSVWFTAAVFVQVALKSQWQDAVLRRDADGGDGKLIIPPRFGREIGYAPTFLMADEAHKSATPEDADFKSLCRSKRASMWELTQSHSSVRATFGPSKEKEANAYFQNSMTHIYLRQPFDLDSLKHIQEECGKRLVPKTTLAVTEGGAGSALSYVQGEIVHEGGMGFSSTKTIAVEEKPFAENEQLLGLPNNIAIVLPSNGDRTLSASVTFLRPLWIFKQYPELSVSTPWAKWPAKERATYNLDNLPQEMHWEGWKSESVPQDEVVPVEARLGRLVQQPSAPIEESRQTAEALEALAHLHMRMNQLPKAAEELKRRIAMGGELLVLRQLRLELAAVCERLNDVDGAITAFEEILQASPADADALINLERLLETAERYEELADVLRLRCGVASGMERAGLLRKLAKVLRQHLHDDEGAKACLAELGGTPAPKDDDQPRRPTPAANAEPSNAGPPPEEPSANEPSANPQDEDLEYGQDEWS